MKKETGIQTQNKEGMIYLAVDHDGVIAILENTKKIQMK